MDNWTRLKLEAENTDKTSKGYNTDMDIIVAGTTKTYREMILQGVNPNNDHAVGEFIDREQENKNMTYAELGQIMLNEAGAEACQSGYGTIDPENVGRSAISYGDINRDGTLN